MAQTASYKVVAALGHMPVKYSSGHAEPSRELLVSVTPGSSASTTGMVLSLANDIKGTILDFSIGMFSAATNTGYRIARYSSASGSASTGKLYFWSTKISSGDDGTNRCVSKNGQDLSGWKFRARVVHT
jgi:hypothetical protein